MGDLVAKQEAYEAAKADADKKFKDASWELVRMRNIARSWGISSSDPAYPDLSYALGDPPVYLD